MAMNKKLESQNEVVIISGAEDVKIFRPGQRFMIDGTIYTVVKAFNADNTEMREITSSYGDREVVTVQTLRKDSGEKGFKMMDPISAADE
jgi:hypothetical protein